MSMIEARNRSIRRTAAALLAAIWALGLSSRAGADGIDVGPNTSPAYVSECGSCHFAYQPGLMPARAWRKVMGNLHDHFGDNAETNAKTRDAILDYLVAGAADVARNPRSRAIMDASTPGDSGMRITSQPYIAGLHGGLLDPLFRGYPRVETLVNCPACHIKATEGVFKARRYNISDDAFRGRNVATGMR
jgi:Dihaem cytochrome c